MPYARLLLAVFGVAAACDQRPPPVIGFPLGPAPPNAADVARAELAGWPGSGGRAPPVVIEHTGSVFAPGTAGEVEVAAQLVARRGLVGVVGHADSRGTLLVAPIYDEAAVPLVVPTATSRRLRGVNRWTFMLAPDDSQEGAFIAEFAARALAARTVGLLYDNDPYGLGLREGIHRGLAEQNLRLSGEGPIGSVCEPGGALGGEASIALVTPPPPARPPDVIVIAGRTRDAACVGRSVRGRIAGARFIMADGVEMDSAFLHALGPIVDSVYVVAFWHRAAPGAASARFVADFERIVGRAPQPSDALHFDALMLLARAVTDVGGDRDAVRRYLVSLGESRPAYEGVTGSISFGPDRRRPLYMMRARSADRGLPVVVP